MAVATTRLTSRHDVLGCGLPEPPSGMSSKYQTHDRHHRTSEYANEYPRSACRWCVKPQRRDLEGFDGRIAKQQLIVAAYHACNSRVRFTQTLGQFGAIVLRVPEINTAANVSDTSSASNALRPVSIS